MRASLIQLSVDASESADERRRRAASLVRGRAGDDLVVLPELWAAAMARSTATASTPARRP